MNVSTWKIVANRYNPFFGCIQLWKVFFHISLQHVDVDIHFFFFVLQWAKKNTKSDSEIEPFVPHLSHIKKSWYHKIVTFKPWSDKLRLFKIQNILLRYTTWTFNWNSTDGLWCYHCHEEMLYVLSLKKLGRISFPLNDLHKSDRLVLTAHFFT